MLDKDKLFDSFRQKAILADQESDYRGQYVLFVRTELSNSHFAKGSVDLSSETLGRIFSSIRSQKETDTVVTIGFIGVIGEVGVLLSWITSGDVSRVYVFSHSEKEGLAIVDTFLVNFQEEKGFSKEALFANFAFLQLRSRLDKIKDQLV